MLEPMLAFQEETECIVTVACLGLRVPVFSRFRFLLCVSSSCSTLHKAQIIPRQKSPKWPKCRTISCDMTHSLLGSSLLLAVLFPTTTPPHLSSHPHQEWHFPLLCYYWWSRGGWHLPQPLSLSGDWEDLPLQCLMRQSRQKSSSFHGFPFLLPSKWAVPGFKMKAWETHPKKGEVLWMRKETFIRKNAEDLWSNIHRVNVAR